MKKLFLLAASLCLILAMAGCNKTEEPQNPDDAEPVVNDNPSTENPGTEDIDPATGDAPANDFLADLVKDQYEGLTITATMLERRAVLPGTSIPLKVVIENTGDKTICFVQGSGSFTTPQALTGNAEHLQYVLPKDNLGIATLDYVVNDLNPGESISFDLNFMAIEPSENFNEHTYDQYGQKQTYIADMAWEDINAAYPELVATEPGSYEAHVYFRYTILEAGSNAVLNANPTGYTEAVATIGVS